MLEDEVEAMFIASSIDGSVGELQGIQDWGDPSVASSLVSNEKSVHVPNFVRAGYHFEMPSESVAIMTHFIVLKY